MRELTQCARTALAYDDNARTHWSRFDCLQPTQIRMPIAKMLCYDSQTLCDRLFLRGVRRLHCAFPTLLPALFGDSGIGSIPWANVPKTQEAPSAPRGSTGQAAAPSITRNDGLVFTPAEPACNVYTTGGCAMPLHARWTAHTARYDSQLYTYSLYLHRGTQEVPTAQGRPVSHRDCGAVSRRRVRRWWDRHTPSHSVIRADE